MTATEPTAAELAAAFCKQLRADLSPAELAVVVERNAAETDPNICHSHDFCDPNQSMIDALATFGMEFEPELCAPINEAWTLAKASGFSL